MLDLEPFLQVWANRLKEEYMGLIKWDFLRVISCCLTQLFRYITNNKEADNDWFRLESNKEGTRWFGKCWHYHNQLKYEFDVEFDIPVTYPMTSPEIALPELDGKTAKVKNITFLLFAGWSLNTLQMYRGGKICLTDHFKPLWGRNAPKFGKCLLIVIKIIIFNLRFKDRYFDNDN